MSKKRQSCACDLCRKAKKKCDGNSPCDRCVSRKKICTYSPLSRSKRAKYNDHQCAVETVNLNGCQNAVVMGNRFVCDNYINLYLNSLNPASAFVTDNNLRVPKTKQGLLQYNAALAAAARSLGEKTLYTSFEKRARQLAGDLMDDFTFDTAVGYYLLSFHLYGENDARACHYCDVTRSLCKQISQNVHIQNDSNECLRLFLLESGISTICQFNVLPDFDELRDITARFDGKLPLEYQSLHRVTALCVKLSRNLFCCDSTGRDTIFEEKTNLFRAIRSPEHFQALWKDCDEIHNIILNDEVFGIDRAIAADVITYLHQVLLYYSVNNVTEAFSRMEKVIELLDMQFIGFYNPYYVSIVHILFTIAFREKRYFLANRVTGVLRNLGTRLPSVQSVLAVEMDLLRTVDESLQQSSYIAQSSFYSSSVTLDTNFIQTLPETNHSQTSTSIGETSNSLVMGDITSTKDAEATRLQEYHPAKTDTTQHVFTKPSHEFQIQNSPTGTTMNPTTRDEPEEITGESIKVSALVEELFVPDDYFIAKFLS